MYIFLKSYDRLLILPIQLEWLDFLLCISWATLITGHSIVGFAMYYFTYDPWIGKLLYLEDFFVMSDYRGMLEFGIGGRLKRNQSSMTLKWLILIVLLSFRLWYRIRNFEESKPGMFTSISLYTPGWPDIHYVALAGLKIASTSLVLGF